MRMERFARPLIVLLVLAAAAGTVAFSLTGAKYTLTLDFTNADGVVKGADVTIAGVNAGKVEDLTVKGKVAAVTVSLDPKFAPVHGGVKAIVRSVGLLGHKYIELIDPKPKGSNVDSGTELTIDSTTSPTDLDQINAIFDASTREKIKTMTNEGAIALGGRAQILNSDLEQLRNLAVAAEPVTGVLDQHQVALDRMTVAFDTFTQKLAIEDASLRSFIEHGSSVLASINAHNQQLAGLLVHGDATFTSLNTALTGNTDNLAGFFARGPSGLTSTNYNLDAGIPGLQMADAFRPSLFDLLYNMADSTTGRTGKADPNSLNSGTIFALRALAVPCITTKPAQPGPLTAC